MSKMLKMNVREVMFKYNLDPSHDVDEMTLHAGTLFTEVTKIGLNMSTK